MATGSTKTVKDLMTKNPAVCVRDTGLQEVAKMMVDCDCGEIPVVNTVDEKKVVGVVTDRDIVCRTVAKGINPLDCAAQDCMSENVCCVQEDASLDEVMDLMEKNKIRRIPVVDQDGLCCGIISQADIARNRQQTRASKVVEEISRPSDEPSALAS